MAKNVKVKEHENLSDSNILKVIELLESTPPITKKDACEILNISYNTTRLNNIIEGYKARKDREHRLRAQNRGKPLTEYEVQEIVSKYLDGENIANIAKELFRSTGIIKNLIDKLGVPTRLPFEQRVKPGILPEQCIAESFYEGQIAWSAVYHSPCQIIKEIENLDYQDKYASKCYQVYVHEPLEEDIPGFSGKVGGYYAYSLAYNLGSLEHLRELGVKL